MVETNKQYLLEKLIELHSDIASLQLDIRTSYWRNYKIDRRLTIANEELTYLRQYIQDNIEDF
jgi:hypothetical protein